MTTPRLTQVEKEGTYHLTTEYKFTCVYLEHDTYLVT